MSKAQQRKVKLHADLIDAAEIRILSAGVSKLRARDLANDVGCSLGAIYNVFADLDTLILHVNLRTMERIDQIMSTALAHDKASSTSTSSIADAGNNLVALAWAYYEYAANNTNSWRSLFDHNFAKDYAVPDWMYQGQLKLLHHIEGPLGELLKLSEPANKSLIARTLFSAVHGIVELSLDGRTIGLPEEAVRQQLKLLIEAFLNGQPGGSKTDDPLSQ